MERVRLRLQLRKQQAKAGDIVLLYGDESEALTHPYLARAWAKSGADLRVPAPGQAKKVAIMGSLDHVTRQLIVHTSATKRSSDFIAHLEQLDRLFGPQPGRQAKPVVLVLDNGPIHLSKAALAALAERAHWLTVEWLAKYAPELNEIEPVWRDLKAHHLAHQTFTDLAALDQAIHDAVVDLNRERIPNPLATPQISAQLSALTQTEGAAEVPPAFAKPTKKPRVLIRCGWSLWAAHMRWIVRSERPIASAMARPVQWVTAPGGSRRVRSTTACTLACGTGGMPGGRVLSRSRPSMPSSANRCCQRHTIGQLMPTRLAISSIGRRSADSRMICAR